MLIRFRKILLKLKHSYKVSVKKQPKNRKNRSLGFSRKQVDKKSRYKNKSQKSDIFLHFWFFGKI